MNKNELEDIEKLCRFFRKYINKPENSSKAGEILVLFKRLDKSIRRLK